MKGLTKVIHDKIFWYILFTDDIVLLNEESRGKFQVGAIEPNFRISIF